MAPRTPILSLFPTYYGSGEVAASLYLVFQVNLGQILFWLLLLLQLWLPILQDILTDTGLGVTGKAELHTVDQVSLSLSRLATFHALSHCLAAEGR